MSLITKKILNSSDQKSVPGLLIYGNLNYRGSGGVSYNGSVITFGERSYISTDSGDTFIEIPCLSALSTLDAPQPPRSTIFYATPSQDGSRILASDQAGYGLRLCKDDGKTLAKTIYIDPFARVPSGNFLNYSGTMAGYVIVNNFYISVDDSVTYNLSLTGVESFTSNNDGSKILALTTDNMIKASTNQGSTWTTILTSTPSNFQSIAASDSTATKLATFGNNGFLYTSENGGIDWSPQTLQLPLYSYNQATYYPSLAMSSDGQKMVAAPYDASGTSIANWTYVYASTDGGTNWYQITNGPKHNLRVGLSKDGNTIMASGGNGNFNDYLWISRDFGLSWRAARWYPA